MALLLGVPLGTALALGRFRGRRVLLAAANTGMGLPPVVVGLFVTVLLWRSGPLGAFGLLYTPTAMVIAQALIATPIVAALTAAALQQVDPDFLLQMRALGATRAWALRALLAEARLPLLAAGLAGFGAVVSEVGAAQMVGGNIQGETRVLTTAAVLATSRGQFALAIAFGLVLLAIAFAVNLFVTLAQQREAPTRRHEHQLPEPAGRGPWPSTARGGLTWRSPTARRWPCSVRTVPGSRRCCGRSSASSRQPRAERCSSTASRSRRGSCAPRSRPCCSVPSCNGPPCSTTPPPACGCGECARPEPADSPGRGSTRSRSRTSPTVTPARCPAARPNAWPSPEPSPSGREVLLLDEPFTGLDATTRADLIADLRAALDQSTAAVLLVTHDRDEAAALAHRTALLLRGRIRQLGATADVLDAPADLECAQLLGYTTHLRPSSPATTCFSSPDPNAAGSSRPGGRRPAPGWSSRARCAGSSRWGEPPGSTSTPQRDPSPS